MQTRSNPLGHDLVCPVCKRDFHAWRADARYCSDACKQRAYRQAKKRMATIKPADQLRNRAHNAVKSLTPEPCLFCNDPNTQAHHHDYSKPRDVTWLCTKHHALVEPHRSSHWRGPDAKNPA